ncbi:MAG: dihydrofolate reductase [Cyclobacteriaceae bacterium]|nr:dihydrofolate reductase [Cyclobacteriaceae bacterium]
MRKLIYPQMVSLDGYIEGQGGTLDWSVPGDVLHKHFNDLYINGVIDTSLYGRKLYETMAAYWPEINEDSEKPEVEKVFARIWKKVPKIVYSKTLEKVEWNSELTRNVIPEDIQGLKRMPGGNIEVAGAELASTFLKLGLVDQIWLYIHPVILGGGKTMFPAKLNIKLNLIDSYTFPCQVIRLRYEINKTIESTTHE